MKTIRTAVLSARAGASAWPASMPVIKVTGGQIRGALDKA